MGTISVDKILRTSTGAAEFTLPATDGTSGQVMQTDGSGQLSLGDYTIPANAVGTTQISNNSVTTAEVAANTITAAQMADSAFLANRNLVRNGAMRIAQRGTTETGWVNKSGYSTCDAFRFSMSATSPGTWTSTQESLTSGAAFTDGFSKAFRVDCTTADASLAADQVFVFQHRMEGYNTQQLKKGSANAESTTISFWVKSNTTGNYSFGLFDKDNDRNIWQLYTISVADTWEKKTITFAGDTTGGSLTNDANSGLEMWWYLAAGTDYTSGTLNTSWAANTWANNVVGQTVNLAASTSNDWAITGVQLEIGTTATPFEHKNYGAELWENQRYYQRVKENWWVYCTAASVIDCFVQFIPDMRAAPSVTLDDTTPTVQKVNVANYTGSSSAITASSLNTTRGFVRMNGFSGLASNSDYLLVSTPFYFDAEL